MTQENIKLWKADGFHDDPFIRAQTLEEAGNNRAILPLAYWIEHFEQNNETAHLLKGTGVFVAGDEEIDALIPFFDDITVIALEFISFSDGRSYSKAAQLKNRGFKGEIRAVGNILIDQVSQLLRVGFDSLEISHALTKQRLEKGEIIHYPVFYQPSAGVEPLSLPTLSRRLWRSI